MFALAMAFRSDTAPVTRLDIGSGVADRGDVGKWNIGSRPKANIPDGAGWRRSSYDTML
jgi:hypothetical protein